VAGIFILINILFGFLEKTILYPSMPFLKKTPVFFRSVNGQYLPFQMCEYQEQS